MFAPEPWKHRAQRSIGQGCQIFLECRPARKKIYCCFCAIFCRQYSISVPPFYWRVFGRQRRLQSFSTALFRQIFPGLGPGQRGGMGWYTIKSAGHFSVNTGDRPPVLFAKQFWCHGANCSGMGREGKKQGYCQLGRVKGTILPDHNGVHLLFFHP